MTKIAILGDVHIRNHNLSSRLTDYNEALFKKFEYVLQQCTKAGIKHLVQLGDFNTTLDTDIRDVFKNRLILLTKKYSSVRIHSIVGNHDIPGNDMNNLYMTSILTLAFANAFNLIITPQHLENIQINVLNPDIKISRQVLADMQESEVPTVILGHHLYEWTLGVEAGLQAKDFEKFATWKHPVTVFLGDDHRQHPVTVLPNVKIHRLGSLMRTEKPKTDEPWQPRYAIFDTDTLSTEYFPIPCEDYATAFGTPNSKEKFVNLASLNKLKKSIERLGTIDYSALTVSKVLMNMQCPPDYMNYLRNVHETAGENF